MRSIYFVSIIVINRGFAPCMNLPRVHLHWETLSEYHPMLQTGRENKDLGVGLRKTALKDILVMYLLT